MAISLIDLDAFIEEKNRMSVPDIFKNFGEDVFRQKEKEALIEVSKFEDVIIATGGGAPCFFDNIQHMNKTGLTLYIKIPNEVIVSRLMNSRHKRPLVDGKSKEELIQFVGDKIIEREKYYLQAKATINPLEQSLEEIVDLIKDLT